MAMEDAPKASAGWYSHSDGTPGERYWDGEAWTGEVRPPALVPSAEPAKRAEGLGCGAAVLIVAALVIGLAVVIGLVVRVNGSSGNSSGSSASTTKLPEGFTDFGNGVAYKGTGKPCTNASLAKTCAEMQLFAYKNCPSLVYIEGNLTSKAGVIYDTVNATVGSMTAGSTAVVQLASYKPIAETPNLTVTKLNCN